MKKSLVIMLLVFAIAGVVVQQAAAQAAAAPAAPAAQAAAAPAAPAAQAAAAPAAPAAPAAQKPQIKDPAEYNAYVSAVQQADPAAKAQAIEAFLQTYPNSVMKEDALVSLMGAYQQAGNAQKTVDTANRVLQANPNNIRALALLAYYYRSLASQGGADATKNADLAMQYGQKGIDALPNTPKPDGMSDADFTKFHNELSAIFEGAVGFAALQKKDLPTAQKDLRGAVEHESQPNIADIYPLATADLEAKPMNPEGFWFIIKASGLAQGPGQQQILDYGRKKYNRYHGSEEGWADLVKQVQSSQGVMPPAGFTVAAAPPPPSPAEQAADLVKSKQPKDMAFAEWQLVLSSGNQQAADTVFDALKDKAVKLVASVISASPTKLTLAGSADDIDDKKADITLTMEKAIPAKYVPQPGTQIVFQGTVSSFAPSPFMFSMTDGVLLDKTGKPIVPAAAPAHKAPAKKQ
jgi:tetratricopeptide (TPR) repeat protein